MTNKQLDLDTLRKDFPILNETMRNKPFTYFDSGATSLKPKSVIDKVSTYYSQYGVNIHRGVYEFSERATREYQEVRTKVSQFIGLKNQDDNPKGHVIFTKSTTESSNLVAHSFGRKFLSKGDIILTTELEHHSNLVPWHGVSESVGCDLRFIPLNEERNELNLDNLDQLFEGPVKILIVTAMSNVTGYIPPIELLIKKAHEHGVPVLLDGAQYVSHHPVDVLSLDVDFLTFSAHKMLGPTGVGVLYGKTEYLEKMDPYLYGGDMIMQVWKDHSTYHPLPEKFEAGTPNIAGVLGFGEALDYLSNVGLDAIYHHEQQLLSYALETLAEIPDLEIYGPKDPNKAGGIVSFNIPGIHPHDIGTILDAMGIAVRAGYHCAMPYMNAMEISGTVRASFYLYNTLEEIDRLKQGILQAQSIFS
jgi:cysteine desulfurase/selenocysteine lyase